jgi:hypothetical protein
MCLDLSGPTAGGRLLVAGWFSFEQMGASAGDLFARDLVCEWLDEEGYAYDVALAAPFEGGVNWQDVNSALYSHVLFVCGPFGNGPPLVEFLEKFRNQSLVGINLTMLQPLSEWDPFALLLERDSSRSTRPDLVFLSDRDRVPVVGLVLIDAQPEYSTDRREVVHAVIDDFIRSREVAVVRIDTRLDENRYGLRSPPEIESLIAKMDVVITTRLHGTVLAIKNGVPVIPIDAVAGGAKITRQVEVLGWPVLIPASQVTVDDIERAFRYCLSPEARATAIECRARARTALASTRTELLDFLRGVNE